ncbi:hypothetical protein [Streptomyces sp. NPDC050738]|uniref:hypothetical protein n=1 Tax=Streptomyces sp. NPDC050738 TaxID=3154744 RepID=UPI00342432BA
MTVFVYDTGMLIALERQATEAHRFHSRVTARRGWHPPVILLPVLAQVWRPQPGHWTPLSRVLPSCAVFGVDRGNQACGVCQAGHLTEDGKRGGVAAGRAVLPPKKRPDAVDALVTVVAARHDRAVILTSDPDDLCAYRDALGVSPSEVAILPVDTLTEFRSGKPMMR